MSKKVDLLDLLLLLFENGTGPDPATGHVIGFKISLKSEMTRVRKLGPITPVERYIDLYLQKVYNSREFVRKFARVSDYEEKKRNRCDECAERNFISHHRRNTSRGENDRRRPFGANDLFSSVYTATLVRTNVGLGNAGLVGGDLSVFRLYD